MFLHYKIFRKDEIPMRIPVLFICFIVFVLWFRVKTKQSKSKTVWDEEFWEKERKANFTRKKDISGLKFLEIDTSKLPFSDSAEGEEMELQNEAKKLSSGKLLNLSGYTNSDIKIEFGQVNFEELTEYDQNFQLLQRALDRWGVFMFEKGEYADSRQILEYALSLGSDISSTYVTLGKIALQNDDLGRIQELIAQIEDTDSIMKTSIVKQLTELLHHY